MTVMRTAGNSHQLPAYARVRDDDGTYAVELDVSDFRQDELTVQVVGRFVTVRAEQRDSVDDETIAFRLHERLEEAFRLPDDGDVDALTATCRHGTLELRVPKLTLKARSIPVEHKWSYPGNPDATPC